MGKKTKKKDEIVIINKFKEKGKEGKEGKESDPENWTEENDRQGRLPHDAAKGKRTRTRKRKLAADKLPKMRAGVLGQTAAGRGESRNVWRPAVYNVRTKGRDERLNRGI